MKKFQCTFLSGRHEVLAVDKSLCKWRGARVMRVSFIDNMLAVCYEHRYTCKFATIRANNICDCKRS